VVAPIIYMADAALTLKLAAGTAAEYNGHATTAEVLPTAGETVSTTTLDGVKHQRQGAPSFALHVVGHQDYSATGLARFLWDHSGELATFTLQAHGATVAASPSTPILAGEVVLVEGAYGGEVDTYPQIDVTLLCTSKPAWDETALAELEAADADPGGSDPGQLEAPAA
jgi:hypothetical protein